MKRRTIARSLGMLLLAASALLDLACVSGGQVDEPPDGTPTGGAAGATAGSGGAAGATGGQATGGAPAGGTDASTSDAGGAGKGGAPGTPDAGTGTDTRPPGDGAVVDGARDGGPPPGDAGTGGRIDAGTGTGGAGVLPPTTIWLAGDSTVQTYAAGNVEGNGGTTLEGWGQELAPFFNDRVTVSNQAIGGRSVAFFMWAVQRDAAGTYLCVDDQGNPQYQLDAAGNHVDTSQWARIKSGIKAGDFLLIQFGTNDETHDCPRFVSLPNFEADLGSWPTRSAPWEPPPSS